MARGDVLIVSLPESDGREQGGRRPAVAVQTDVAGDPMLIVAPVTSSVAAERFPFTIRIEPSPDNGLTQISIIMVFQLRAIDKNRIVKTVGRLSDEDMKKIDAEIWKMLRPDRS